MEQLTRAGGEKAVALNYLDVWICVLVLASLDSWIDMRLDSWLLVIGTQTIPK